MTKELLTVEFRYNIGATRTITIGVYDTLKEAVVEGNKVLAILANTFEVRKDDIFAEKGLFGIPNRLVTNTCYPTKGVQYFAKITQLKFDDLDAAVLAAFEASKVLKNLLQ